MNDRPVIAVTSCNKPVEDETAFIVKHRYVDAVARFADAIPLIVPALGKPEDAIALVPRVDAILLTGSSSNIEPRNFRGQEPAREPTDPARDRTAISLIKAAQHFGVPVIGVCRGLQEINVALGGTIQNTPEPEAGTHHAPDGVDVPSMFTHTHPVSLAPASYLSRTLGASDLEVNSVHFQRVGELGRDLRVEATAPDGTIEAFASRETDPKIIGVQWHPEWRPNERPHDLAFWRLVGDMARRRQREQPSIG